MRTYDTLLGTLLIGTWINMMLYVWELVQIRRYIESYPSDRLLIKITVASTFFSDSAATIGGLIFVYLNTVIHWGDDEYLLKQPSWAEFLFIAATGASAAITQTFLVYRYWKLTRHIVISVVILILMVTSIAGSIACVVNLAHYSDFSQLRSFKWSTGLWFASSAATDIITAAVLLIQFIRIDATFKSTRRLLRKLVALTIKTGTITAVWALVILATYFAYPEDNIALAIGFCLGRVYTLTLLFNLNIRCSLRRQDTMIDVETIHLDDLTPVTDENVHSGNSDTTLLNISKNLKDFFMISTHTVNSSSTPEGVPGARQP